MRMPRVPLDDGQSPGDGASTVRVGRLDHRTCGDHRPGEAASRSMVLVRCSTVGSGRSGTVPGARGSALSSRLSSAAIPDVAWVRPSTSWAHAFRLSGPGRVPPS